MKPKTLILSVTLCCSCIILLLLLYCNKSIIKSTTQTSVRINTSFLKAIETDAEKRLKEIGPIVTLGYRNLSDSLSGQNGIIIRTETKEKFIPHTFEGISVSKRISIISQTIAATYNPIRATSLDSIFQEKLIKNGIHARSLVRYQINGEVYYSSPDLGLLSSGLHSKEITTGIYDEIKLQAFIHYPVLERLKRTRTVLSILLTGFLLSIIYQLFTKKQTINVSSVTDEPGVPEEITFSPETPSNPEVTETFRIEDIRFDLQGNKLWINDKITKLTKQNIKLLKALLEAPEHYMTRDDIYPHMWNDYIRDYNKLNKCTERLRETISLENPRIEIITHHKRGIELAVTPPSENLLLTKKDLLFENDNPQV